MTSRCCFRTVQQFLQPAHTWNVSKWTSKEKLCPGKSKHLKDEWDCLTEYWNVCPTSWTPCQCPRWRRPCSATWSRDRSSRCPRPQDPRNQQTGRTRGSWGRISFQGLVDKKLIFLFVIFDHIVTTTKLVELVVAEKKYHFKFTWKYRFKLTWKHNSSWLDD